MYSSRRRTARSLTISRSIQWGSAQPPLDPDPPSRMQTPHPGCRPPYPGCRTPVNRMTHRCKNITLPQTSFAGGNKNYNFTYIKFKFEAYFGYFFVFYSGPFKSFVKICVLYKHMSIKTTKSYYTELFKWHLTS